MVPTGCRHIWSSGVVSCPPPPSRSQATANTHAAAGSHQAGQAAHWHQPGGYRGVCVHAPYSPQPSPTHGLKQY